MSCRTDQLIKHTVWFFIWHSALKELYMPVLLLRGLEGFSMTDFSHKALQRGSWHSEIFITLRSGGQRHASSIWKTNTHGGSCETHFTSRICRPTAVRTHSWCKHHLQYIHNILHIHCKMKQKMQFISLTVEVKHFCCRPLKIIFH